MKLTDKIKELKDVLSDEQLVSLEDTIKEMVESEVGLRTEEKINELEAKADEYCEQEIAKKVEEEKEALIEQYDGKLEELEENIVEKMDQFLEAEINEQISDEAVEKVAINETFEPIIKGIMHLFEDKYVSLDSEGNKVLAEQKAKTEELEEKVSELIADKMELSTLAESAAVKLLIAEKTEDMTETQKDRVKTFFEGKSFDDAKEKIDSFVELIEESDESDNDEDTEDINENEENNFSNEDGEATEENENKEIVTENEENKDEEDGDKPYSTPTINKAQDFL